MITDREIRERYRSYANDPRLCFFEDPHLWCPRCGGCEAFHPESCDITPEEWSSASKAVDDARRTGDVWRAIGLLQFAVRLRRPFEELAAQS